MKRLWEYKTEDIVRICKGKTLIVYGTPRTILGTIHIANEHESLSFNCKDGIEIETGWIPKSKEYFSQRWINAQNLQELEILMHTTMQVEMHVSRKPRLDCIDE